MAHRIIYLHPPPLLRALTPLKFYVYVNFHLCELYIAINVINGILKNACRNSTGMVHNQAWNFHGLVKM